jgi:quercetin 2,3-dioxygenase
MTENPNQPTKTFKTIKQIILPPSPHWVGNGFLVNGFLTEFSPENSPFLMLDYASRKVFESSNVQRGVGSHPHRGFETVTIALRGKIEHHDSRGNHGIIGEGDVQWMTAGSGILHQEYFEKNFNHSGGELQMIQLWVNLPSQHKMTTPKYQEIKNSDIPVVTKDGFEIKIIAGELDDMVGPAATFTEMNVWIVESESEKLKTKSEKYLNLEFSSKNNSMILVLEGSIEINDVLVPSSRMVKFNNDGSSIIIKSDSDCKFLVLSGEPINEPIAHYGPFVMNTKAEIMEAIEDFNGGKFGEL